MSKLRLVAVYCCTLFMAFQTTAAELPKSGSIKFQTGWKDTGQVLTVADKHLQGHGSVIGVTTNDRGAGPLHKGPAECFYSFFVIEGHGKNKGYCAFGDVDGDRIFTDWSGMVTPDGNSGSNVITGGTGKYAGIRGDGPWKCKDIGQSGAVSCEQILNYQLP